MASHATGQRSNLPHLTGSQPRSAFPSVEPQGGVEKLLRNNRSRMTNICVQRFLATLPPLLRKWAKERKEQDPSYFDRLCAQQVCAVCYLVSLKADACFLSPGSRVPVDRMRRFSCSGQRHHRA